MFRCPLSRAAATLLIIAGAAIPAGASAWYAPATCHHWNAWGECADWSTFERRYYPSPAYGGMRSTENPHAAFYRHYLNLKTPATRTATTPLRRVSYTSQCNDPTTDCTGRLSVRLRAAPNPAPLGQLLTYTIYVRNDDSQMRNVNVRAYLDENTTFDAATYGGYEDGDVIRWDALRIPAYDSRSFTLRVAVRSNAPTGTPIRLKVQAGNSVDSVAVNVLDAGFYDNAMQVNDNGITVRFNHYTGRRELQTRPTYYHDKFGDVYTR